MHKIFKEVRDGPTKNEQALRDYQIWQKRLKKEPKGCLEVKIVVGIKTSIG